MRSGQMCSILQFMLCDPAISLMIMQQQLAVGALA